MASFAKEVEGGAELGSSAAVLVHADGELCKPCDVSPNSSSTFLSEKLAYIRRVPWDLVTLFIVLMVVWGLLLLPIIYFHTEIVSE
jgi:hypothetical protein